MNTIPAGSLNTSSGGPVALAIVLGGALMMWPAFFNGYPLLYSDTNAFLDQGVQGLMIWDKPFIYGPWMLAMHWRLSLWLPCAAQALLLSAMIWLARAVISPPGAVRHIMVCAALAAFTAAPWFASFLMPDAFTVMVILGIFILAFGDRIGRTARILVCLVTALGIAVHLTHLLIAAAVVMVVVALRRAAVWRASMPLAIAVAVIAVTNIIGFGKVAISPFGSVFLLARLASDGPAARTIERACPSAGWHMCAWIDRIPADSDDFLWDGKGPVWSHPGGPIGLAGEASTIIGQTIRSEPIRVLELAITNTWRQLQLVGLGDTLRPQWLEGSVGKTLSAYFPPRELAAYRASLQAADTLEPTAARLNALQLAVLIAGLCVTLALLARATLLGDRVIAALCLMALLGLAVNAFATGALSRPHYRYQTRIAWILVLVPLIAIPGAASARRLTAGGTRDAIAAKL
ncbi:MAG: hypothetical protein IT507_11555 [Burkholderiaceae bacterium]|nr:hypothetical protein [Burkholderiaceae bacterium]